MDTLDVIEVNRMLFGVIETIDVIEVNQMLFGAIETINVIELDVIDTLMSLRWI